MNLLRSDAYSGGAWVAAGNGCRFTVRNPATGEELAQVADLDAADAQKAIAHAADASHGWRSRTAKERATLMRTWFELIMANQQDLARIMTAEQGKPPAEKASSRARSCPSAA